jgi:hypothetical protein
MKYSLYSGLLLLLMACSSEYKMLRPVTPDPQCAERLRPSGMTTSWYDASVDVMGRHVSGLLLVKEMPDRSVRMVLTSEAGFTFLDMEFGPEGQFQVKHVFPKLDKKPVIQTFRKDFELMLGFPFRNNDYQAWSSGNEVFYGFPQKKETAYFITGPDCASLRRMEMGSKRKRKVSVVLSGDDLRHPDSVRLTHHTFDMVMNLKKIERQ